ncbi:MAG: putative manganese transporter [Desulfobacterales bacterium]
MGNNVIGVFNHSLMITGFVFVMMLVIEYVNVLTSGVWQRRITASRWRQYLFGAMMGAVPGCLGAFIVVAMYSHRMLSLGAIVAAMISTSGDEAFVMLAMIPGHAVLLMIALFFIGFLAGFLTDAFTGQYKTRKLAKCDGFGLHTFENCGCFSADRILEQWKHRSPFRTVLMVFLSLFIIAVISGQIGPAVWNWVSISILLVTGLAIFIVFTVPDHFLEEHLWNHVARKHVPRIFLWAFGVLLILHLLIDQLHLTDIIQSSRWAVLGIASLVGIIPESGPHLLFVTLFAKGAIPFSILMASSIVQDGHGMLPVLAHSRRDFILIKSINFLVGLAIGTISVSFGF